MAPDRDRPLWRCEACGRSFANRNQTHSCATWTLERHFSGRDPVVRDIFDAFLAMLEESGPVTVLPEKTRIAFQARMSFAQLTTRRAWVSGHFVLGRRIEDPAIGRIECLSRRNHVHHFRLVSPREVAALRGVAAEARRVGDQAHLAKGSGESQ